jgi:hypothetical protein
MTILLLICLQVLIIQVSWAIYVLSAVQISEGVDSHKQLVLG